MMKGKTSTIIFFPGDKYYLPHEWINNKFLWRNEKCFVDYMMKRNDSYYSDSVMIFYVFKLLSLLLIVLLIIVSHYCFLRPIFLYFR